MDTEDVLQGCLDAHRELLELERGFRAWLVEMTGFERKAPDAAS